MSKLIALGLTLAGLVAFAAAPSSLALAVDEINATPGRTIQGAGLAVHGFDPVAFFAQGRPLIGSAKYAVVHDGATYRFASAANMKIFQSSPNQYVPAFGGYCSYGVAVGAKFDGDPRYWKIVDGKLYLTLNEQIQETWLQDVPGNIRKAKKNWTQIKHKDPSDLG